MVCRGRDPGPGAGTDGSAGASGALGIKGVDTLSARGTVDFCASSCPPAELSGLLLDLRAVNFLEGIMKGLSNSRTVSLEGIYKSCSHKLTLIVFWCSS